MAVLTEIRRRPWLLMGVIALALLAFLVNPDSINKFFGKNPNVFGEVNGEKITREEFADQLFVMQQQAQQQNQPTTGLEEQAWQVLVQSKLVKQQFEKLGLKMTDDLFWSQLQFDPMFAQNQQYFDEKGNFKINDVKKQIAELEKSGDAMYGNWLKMRKSIEYRMMARILFNNLGSGVTANKKEAEQMMKFRDQLADIDFVKVDYATFLQKNPIKVTTQDLADYIKLHPIQFKTDPTVNVGLVYFPAAPSAADEAGVQKEMTTLVSGGEENFTNTKSDSMFVSVNSDVPYNPEFVGAAQLPPSIKDQLMAAAPGQIFGPYKEQDVIIASKLLAKKPSDSTLSRHILISYKGNEAGTGVTRSKEAAKKLADSIGAIVKANPAKFDEFLKLSNDPSSAAQGGSVGWTTPSTPFVPEFLNYLASNGKGATGVVETRFGYHIINIQDKKSGAMTYKVANLVKQIKPSDATDAELDRKAKKFIQQVSGKSFNEFSNLAKKSGYQFTNPKTVKRFDGRLDGLGTDKDSEIITWAFDKRREKGDNEFFAVDGTGDRIVAIFNSKQSDGTADPESVREQLEPIVKNKLAAKKIIEKITSSKATSLQQVATAFGTSAQSGQVNMLSPQVGGAMEPKVAGAAFGVSKGKLSLPVEGMTGVYVLVKKAETVNKLPGDAKQMAEQLQQQNASMFGQMYLKSLQDNAKIKDYRADVWNATGN